MSTTDDTLANRPAITPAQIAAGIVALLGPVAEFGQAFGLYTFTIAEQAAVKNLSLGLAAFAAIWVAADAHLRSSRNKAAATVKAAAVTAELPLSDLHETVHDATTEALADTQKARDWNVSGVGLTGALAAPEPVDLDDPYLDIPGHGQPAEPDVETRESHTGLSDEPAGHKGRDEPA